METIIFNLGSFDNVQMYARNEIDVARVTGQTVEKLLDPSDPLNSELLAGPAAFAVRFIGFNTTMPPFDDARFRQALNHATDTQPLADDALSGRVQPAIGILPPGFPGFNPFMEGLTYDPELAKQLLSESSHADPNSRPPIVLTLPPGSQASIAALEAVAEMWRQVLGVAVEVRHLDWAALLQGLTSRAFQAYSLAWLADYPDPHAVLDVLFHSESNFNYGVYSNPEVDKLLETARVEQDPQRRTQLYQEVENRVVAAAAWLPLWFGGGQYALVKPHVKGFQLTPIVIPKLRYVTIEGAAPPQTVVELGYTHTLSRDGGDLSGGDLSSEEWEPGKGIQRSAWGYGSSIPLALQATVEGSPINSGGVSSVSEEAGLFTYTWEPTTNVYMSLREGFLADSGLRFSRSVAPSILPPGSSSVTIEASVEILRRPTVNDAQVTPIGGFVRMFWFDDDSRYPGTKPIKLITTPEATSLQFGPPFDPGRVYTLRILAILENPNSFPVYYLPYIEAALNIDTESDTALQGYRTKGI